MARKRPKTVRFPGVSALAPHFIGATLVHRRAGAPGRCEREQAPDGGLERVGRATV